MSAPVVWIYAHPLAGRSLANRELLEAVGDLPFVDRRPLYDLYPDFDIDVDAERRVLESAELVVLQHPIHWYGMPPLLKLWIDEVFGIGWAYGEDGHALVGKRMLWVVTTGGDLRAYASDGPHGHPFDAFVAPVRQTALFCGMRWEEPLVVHDAHADRGHVRTAGERLRERIVAYAPRPEPVRARPAVPDATTGRPLASLAATE